MKPGPVLARRSRGKVSAPSWIQELGENMRLEGFNVLVLLVMLVIAAAVIGAVTLIVRWTLRFANRRRGGHGQGPTQP